MNQVSVFRKRMSTMYLFTLVLKIKGVTEPLWERKRMVGQDKKGPNPLGRIPMFPTGQLVVNIPGE